MQTYEAFAARVSGPPSDATAGPSAAPSASPPPPPLATLAEAYDVYVNLARTGLWFDVNPRWHARLGVYYLRCEPNAAAASKRPPNDDDAPTRRAPDERPPPTVVEPANDAGAIPPPPPPDDARRHPHPPPVPPRPPPPRTRQVTVPVASSRAALDPKRLRDLAALGDEWLSETRDGDVAYAAAVEEPRAAERDEGEEGPRANDATALRASSSSPLLAPPRFDARRAVPTNLALIDTDGTMVVIGIERGLIEPEDLEPPPEHGYARGGVVGGKDPKDASANVDARGGGGGLDMAATDTAGGARLAIFGEEEAGAVASYGRERANSASGDELEEELDEADALSARDALAAKEAAARGGEGGGEEGGGE